MSFTVTVSSPAMPELPLEFFQMYGEEALSRLYNYVFVLKTPGDPHIPRSEAANLDYKQLVGKEFTAHIELSDLGRREISGLVVSAQIVESADQQTTYEVTIRPWLILAAQTSDYKRFQEKTVVQILDEVLSNYNFPLEKRLSGNYPILDYQVQYGETDYHFIQRLMQEWGIYWFFEHSKGAHRLVLIDDMSAHLAAPHADMLYNTEGKIDEEHLSAFSAVENHQPGQWVTNDFDFKKPLADLEVLDVKPRNTGFPSQELYDWPGDYTDTDIGKQLAEIRMHAAGVAGSLATGSGNVRGLPCGFTFTLRGYPADKANQEYLVASAFLQLSETGRTSGQSEYNCHCSFTFFPTDKVFRQSRTISKPVTLGPQTAVVVGPAGEEIYTDQYGRIKVQFHWDRYGQNNQDSSCWIRVAYPWAGSNFGGIHIPRIGQEVIVDFENGDPDRPIVTGRVYNAANMPPWDLPSNMTQSGVLSRSSHGGGYENANALRFEDKKGAEQVWLHAEKNQDIEVENDETHWVGHDRRKVIDNDETSHIKNNRTETVGQNESVDIGSNRNLAVGVNENVDIGADRNMAVGLNDTTNIGANRNAAVGLNEVTTVGGNSIMAVGGNRLETTLCGMAETTVLAKALTVGLGYQTTVGAVMNTTVGLMQFEEVGLTKGTLVGKDYVIIARNEFMVKVGKSALVLKSDGTVEVVGTQIDFK